MKKRLYSHPIGCEELNRINNENSYEVTFENHETLDTITCFECNGELYHLDMLFNNELTIDIINNKYVAIV